MSRWITAEEISRRYAPKQRLLVAGVRAPGLDVKKRIKKPRAHIYGLLYLPKLKCIPEDRPQFRILDLATWQDRDFAQEMGENYASCNPDELPTFFATVPHPQPRAS